MRHLSCSRVQEILQRAQHHATEINVDACITIVDNSAHLLAFVRMEGAAIGPIDVCQRKARTAALFNCDSGEFGKLVSDQQLQGMIDSNGGLAAFPGGVPIHSEGELLGAIGVSGGSAEQDQTIAQYALEE